MSKKEAKVLPEKEESLPLFLEDEHQQVYYVKDQQMYYVKVGASLLVYRKGEELTEWVNKLLAVGTPRAAITIIYGKVIHFTTQKTETVKEFLL